MKAPRERSRVHKIRSAPSLYLATAAGAVLLLLVISQIGPSRDGSRLLVDRAVDASVPAVDRGRPLPDAAPPQQLPGPRAVEVYFRAKQIVAQTRYLKVAREQRGTYYLPKGLGSDQPCPPVCYEPPGFYDEEWSRTWEYDFVAQRARVRIDRPRAERHLEEVFVGSRSYTRVNGIGAWFIQDKYFEGVQRDVYAGGVYEQYLHFDLGWHGPWPVAYYRWGFKADDAFEENLDGAMKPELGPDVACAQSRCWTLIHRWRPEAGGQRGAVTWTLAVEQRTGRAVEARYELVWDDGRRLEALTRLYDYGVPNVIEPPTGG